MMRDVCLWCVALTLTACAWPEAGNGTSETAKRPISGYLRLEVSGQIDRLEVRACDCERVEVTTDLNLLRHVRSEVVGDVLVVETTELVEPTVPIHVIVYTKSLGALTLRDELRVKLTDVGSESFEGVVEGRAHLEIEGASAALTLEVSGDASAKVTGARAESLSAQISGAGVFEGSALEVTTTQVEVSGAGRVELEGVGESLTVFGSGGARVEALSHKTQDAEVRVSGEVRVSVCASRELDVEANGGARVVYGCAPQEVRDRGGAGSVIEPAL